MNVIRVVIALMFIGGAVTAVGYGAYTGYEFLAVKWQSLNDEWRAVLSIIGAMLAVCTLFVSTSVHTAFRRYGAKSAGKVMAYNDFVRWYDAFRDADGKMSADAFKPVVNQMVLWGGGIVANRCRKLYELLKQGDAGSEELQRLAGNINTEIRRDLGLGGARGDNTIV